MNIIGVSRDNLYSPNHIGNDAAILNKVIATLSSYGHKTQLYTEEQFVSLPIPDKRNVIVNMARDKQTLLRIKEWEKKGIKAFNSTQGIANCIREEMTRLLVRNNMPHPQSWVFHISQSPMVQPAFPCWIKRGDSHAMVKEDVCFVTQAEEMRCVLKDFDKRKISTVVINAHLQGDLIKFYGVQDSPFFYWFYPSSCSHSKFGLESINGEASGFPFNPDALKNYANQISLLLDVPIFGGDAIIQKDGSIHVIDFNDWPSFAPCREKAGEAIADYIHKQILNMPFS